MIQSVDEKYMSRCIQIARGGMLGAAPNPMVGAVVVCDGRIIGEGYHVRCGEGHAEVNAIASVKDKALLSRSTIYVSLEPCSHYGKTPPCADLIISHHIPRVVVGCQDPFAKVSGRGIQKLRDAGIEVTVGVLEEECRKLNKSFMTFHTQKRPFITLKWAQSADGMVDKVRTDGSPVVLSTPLTQMLVHKRRAEHKAILVGARTALLDNPSLTVRAWSGPSPLRIVMDRTLSLPRSLKVFDKSVPTWVLCDKSNVAIPESSDNLRYVALDFGRDILEQLFQEMYSANVPSLLVEGGPATLQRFIEIGAWDEAYVEHSEKVVGDGVVAPTIAEECLKSVDRQFGVSIYHYCNPLNPYI